MNLLKISLLSLLISFIACSKKEPIPVPNDKQDYIGTWSAQGVRLKIYKDGKVVYTNKKDGKNISVEGPIVDFSGSDFEVKSWDSGMDFDVSKTPYQDKADYYMHVNGDKLRKVGL